MIPFPTESNPLDLLANLYVETKKSNNTVWIREKSTGEYEVFIPEKSKKTQEETKKALDIALSILTKYEASFRVYELTHFQFLSQLSQSFKKIEMLEDLQALEGQIRKIIQLSHLAFHQLNISTKVPALERYQDVIDWKPLPYVETLREKCDVVFLVGEDKVPIPVHCAMLVKDCKYFRALLSGSYRENSITDAVSFPDITPKTFLNFLICLYKETLPKDIDDLLDLGVLIDMIGYKEIIDDVCNNIRLHLLRLTHKEFLIKFARIHLSESIREVFLEGLMRRFEMINFDDLNEELLFYVANHDCLPLSESSLYARLISWEKKRLTGKQRRGPILCKGVKLISSVRFENLPLSYFLKNVFPSRYLSNDEKVKYQSMILAKSDYKCYIDKSLIYRPDRTNTVDIEKINDHQYIVSLSIPITEHDLMFDDELPTCCIYQTREFSMFGYSWSMKIYRDLQHGKFVHMVSLYEKNEVKKPLKLTCAYKFGISPNIYEKSVQGTLKEEGYLHLSSSRDLENRPFFTDFLNNNTLHIKCKVDLQ